jgi:hypothetical protein
MNFAKFYHTKVVAALLLLLAFMFTGCSDNPNDNDSVTLNGTWVSDFGDGYTININAETLEYDDGGYGIGFDGTILKINKFDNAGTAGIIFIEYVDKPIDFSTGTEPAGDFIGIYFRNLTSTTVQFASPVEEYEPEKYRTPAKNSLEEAENSFTVDSANNYVSFWGTYSK